MCVWLYSDGSSGYHGPDVFDVVDLPKSWLEKRKKSKKRKEHDDEGAPRVPFCCSPLLVCASSTLVLDLCSSDYNLD